MHQLVHQNLHQVGLRLMAKAPSQQLWQRGPGKPWYVRRVVPERLRAIVGKSVLSRSTGEVDRKRGERASWRIKIEFDEMLRRAEQELCEQSEGANGASEGHRDFWEAYQETAANEAFLAISEHYIDHHPWEEAEDGKVTAAFQEALLAQYKADLQSTRRKIGRGDLSEFEAEASSGTWSFAAEDLTGMSTPAVGAPDHVVKKVAPKIANGHVAALERAIAVFSGDPEPVFTDPDITDLRAPKLSQALESWMAARKSSHTARPKE